ncbi:MAG: beta-ketoacyl-[acyl-carrier-protein] synthase family protein, partial [Planctomycetaceae bacterium]|nr:beta-ketoacyl-[acyl-carrier-protein] synthase family protein [Planctomycetaceae bacterium]
PALDDGVCHPTINVDDLDPACEIANLVLNTPKHIGDVRVILNNSFGMVGINSVVIVRRYS